MLGITLWGGFHTWVAAFGPNVDPDWRVWKGLVIAACVALFLGFWGLMLVIRRRRLAIAAAREATTADATQPAVTNGGE